MSSWWPALVHELGIQRAANHPEWRANGGCFYKARGESCELAIDPKRQHAPRTCGDVAEVQPRVDPKGRKGVSHNTSSCEKLWTYYTPAVAAAATSLYELDLDAFQYPRWAAEAGTLPW